MDLTYSQKPEHTKRGYGGMNAEEKKKGKTKAENVRHHLKRYYVRHAH